MPSSHYLRPFIIVASILLASGCQITKTPISMVQITEQQNYGAYYLKLKDLNTAELEQEVIKQKRIISENNNDATQDSSQIKMLFLYSFPASPIYNSYRAKALLNEIKNVDNNKTLSAISASDQALISLLRDQLNQKLLMRNRLLEQQKHQQIVTKQNINNLSEQVRLLQKTIVQLKEIEQAINQRDQ